VSKQNKNINGLKSWWLRKPSLPKFTNRYWTCRKTIWM